jgi:hypothetical protein
MILGQAAPVTLTLVKHAPAARLSRDRVEQMYSRRG